MVHEKHSLLLPRIPIKCDIGWVVILLDIRAIKYIIHRSGYWVETAASADGYGILPDYQVFSDSYERGVREIMTSLQLLVGVIGSPQTTLYGVSAAATNVIPPTNPNIPFYHRPMLPQFNCKCYDADKCYKINEHLGAANVTHWLPQTNSHHKYKCITTKWQTNVRTSWESIMWDIGQYNSIIII